MSDEEKFDQVFCKMERLAKVLGKAGPNGKKNPFIVYMEKYRGFYNKTEKKQHLDYFRNVYKSNRQNILQGYANDGWLRGGNIVIMYGSEVGLQTKGKIHLSVFYNMACKCQEEDQENVYKERYMLYLYQIFELVASEKDTIRGQIREVQGVIGDRDEKDTTTLPSTQDPLGGLLNMFGGLLSTLTNNGQGGGEAINNMFQNQNLTNTISQIFQDPNTKSFLGDIVKEISSAKGPKELINVVTNRIGDPKLTEAVDNLVNTPQLAQAMNGLNNLSLPTGQQEESNPDEQE